VEQLVESVISRSQQTYFGKYRGLVVDNDDPEKRARVTLRVPSVLGDEVITHWAEPCLPFGGYQDQGLFMVPAVDAQVWVEFEAGDINHPIWTGTTWQQSSDVPSEASDGSPHIHQLKTSSGHILLFDDNEDAEEIKLFHKADAQLNINSEGVITLMDAAGSTLTLDAAGSKIDITDSNGNSMVMESSGTTVSDANGNQIEMSAGGVTVSSSGTVNIEGSMVNVGGAGGEPIIKGQSFLSLFATHMHTSSPTGGPTSPPIPQGEMSTLSMTNMVK